MPILLDRELAKRYQNEDSKALGELLNRYKPLIIRTASSIRSTTGLELEDIKQDIILEFIGRVANYKEVGKVTFAGFIKSHLRWFSKKVIAKNYAVNELPYCDNIASTREGDEAIKKAMLQLTETDRNVVKMYYYEGYTEKEIAEILEMSQSSISNRLAKIRKELKGLLA